MVSVPSTSEEWLQFSIGSAVGLLFEASSNLNLFFDTMLGLCLDAVGETAISVLTLSIYWYTWAQTGEDDIYNLFLSFPSVFHLYWALIKSQAYCLKTLDTNNINFFDDPSRYRGEFWYMAFAFITDGLL